MTYTQRNAEVQAAIEIGKSFTQVEYFYEEDINGTFVRAYHKDSGYSSKYYFS